MPSEIHGQPGLQSFQRKEVWEYPLDALREAVVNALVHRDYFESSMDIMLRVYDDQVVITNPGGLPQGITIEEIKRRNHPSVPRNPMLAQVFYYAQLVERWGTGTSKMIELCQNHGIPAPEFEDSRSWFQVTFTKDTYNKERLLQMGLTDRQIQAILLVKQKGSITNKEYQELTRASRRTATRDLSELVERGLLEQAGRTKGADYRLKRP